MSTPKPTRLVQGLGEESARSTEIPSTSQPSAVGSAAPDEAYNLSNLTHNLSNGSAPPALLAAASTQVPGDKPEILNPESSVLNPEPQTLQP